jgi:Mce-associated membrane protein
VAERDELVDDTAAPGSARDVDAAGPVTDGADAQPPPEPPAEPEPPVEPEAPVGASPAAVEASPAAVEASPAAVEASPAAEEPELPPAERDGEVAEGGDVAEVDAAAPTSDPDAEAEQTDVHAVAADEPAPRLSPIRRLLGNARIAWIIAGISLLGLVAFAIAALPTLGAERERQEVRERAELIAARVTTFEGETIEEWLEETRALATGAYAERLEQVFDPQLRDALREGEVESVGRIDRSFVQALEGDTAEVFVLATQSSSNNLRDDAITDELRIQVTLQREDGTWLASDIVVLGPQAQAVAPSPEGDLGDGADGSQAEDGS